MAPVEHEVMPFLQMLGLVLQAAPAVQATQVPLPLQTMFVPQGVPADLSPASTQVMAPVVQEDVPALQGFGLPVQDWPAVQAMQPPVPLQTMLVPQLTPGILLLPSVQVGTPLEQVIVPFLHGLALPVQDWPAVQATQAPAPLQTRLVPQLVPATFGVPFTQVDMPVEQDATPS
jgi:hypothetical protein